jgi:hypothetical protein
MVWCEGKKGCVPFWLAAECQDWKSFFKKKQPLDKAVEAAEAALADAQAANLDKKPGSKEDLQSKQKAVDNAITSAIVVDAAIVSVEEMEYADVMPTLDDMEFVDAANKAAVAMKLKSKSAKTKKEKKAFLKMVSQELDKSANAHAAVLTQDKALAKILPAARKSKEMEEEATAAGNAQSIAEAQLKKAIAAEEAALEKMFMAESSKAPTGAAMKSQATAAIKASPVQALLASVAQQTKRKVAALKAEAAADREFEEVRPYVMLVGCNASPFVCSRRRKY